MKVTKKKLGMESLEIKYSVKSSPSEVSDLVVMEVSLGDLMGEGEGENIDVARDMAAVRMLDQLKKMNLKHIKVAYGATKKNKTVVEKEEKND